MFLVSKHCNTDSISGNKIYISVISINIRISQVVEIHPLGLVYHITNSMVADALLMQVTHPTFNTPTS